jgi:hypothetical protein
MRYAVRRLPALILVLVLAVVTWLQEEQPPANDEMALRFVPQRLPGKAALAPHLGAFELEGVWRLDSPHHRFGGYSALVPLGDGQLLAFSDRGYLLQFSPPGAPRRPLRIGPIARELAKGGTIYDAEAATLDPAAGLVWIAWENRNTITRHRLAFDAPQRTRPPAMRDWGNNSGPEAMARLADGRFLVLREGFDDWLQRDRHRGLIFTGDPLAAKNPQAFTFVGPAGFSPTDMARLPDGRMLILMRRLVWPLPARFVGRIVIADPREIAEGSVWRSLVVAKLSSSLPVDNFEGLAIEPRKDGRVTVWLISDANGAVSQRTLLWKLAVDPAKLPAE